MTQSELCKALKRFWMLIEPLVDLWKQSKSSKLDQVFPDLKLMLKMRKFLYVPWNEPKHQKWVWYQFLLLKKCTVPNLSKIPLKTSNLKFLGSLGPLIRGAGLAKSISRLPECPNQLVYFTIISFFVSNLSFSVEKSKISQLRPKLWPPKVEVKKFLELKSVKILKKSTFCAIFIKSP